MELFEAGHEIKYLGIRRVAAGVILLGGADDDIDDIGEAAAATAALLHRVVDLRRHDKLPTIFVEKVGDNLPDFLVGYVIAATDKHVFIPNMTLTIVFSAKEDGDCQEKIRVRRRRQQQWAQSVRIVWSRTYSYDPDRAGIISCRHDFDRRDKLQ